MNVKVTYMLIHIRAHACLGLAYNFTISRTETPLGNSGYLGQNIHLVLQVLSRLAENNLQ